MLELYNEKQPNHIPGMRWNSIWAFVNKSDVTKVGWLILCRVASTCSLQDKRLGGHSSSYCFNGPVYFAQILSCYITRRWMQWSLEIMRPACDWTVLCGCILIHHPNKPLFSVCLSGVAAVPLYIGHLMIWGIKT